MAHQKSENLDLAHSIKHLSTPAVVFTRFNHFLFVQFGLYLSSVQVLLAYIYGVGSGC